MKQSLLLRIGYDVQYKEYMSDNNGDDKITNLTAIHDMNKRIMEEQNTLLQPLWRSLMNIKTPRQAINCASAMIVAGKDLLLLELGEETARNFIDNLRYDTVELVNSKKNALEAEMAKIDAEATAPDNSVKVDFVKKKILDKDEEPTILK